MPSPGVPRSRSLLSRFIPRLRRKAGSRNEAPTTTSRPRNAPTSRRDRGRVGNREEHHHLFLAMDNKKSKNMNKKANNAIKALKKAKSHLTLGNVQTVHMEVRGATAPFTPETQKRTNRTRENAEKMAANDERKRKKAEAKGKMSSANAARDKKESIATWTRKYSHGYGNDEEESPSIGSRPRFKRWGSPSIARLGARLARDRMENTRPKVNTRSKVTV